MKKFFIALFSLVAMVFVFTACGSSETKKIESKLEERVKESSFGFIKKSKTLQLDIDTVRVSDVKGFIEASFPKSNFPNGIPSDFRDKDFSKFIAPLKDHTNLDDVVYLAVVYKAEHKISVDLLGRPEIIRTDYWLIDPVTYDYVMDDIRNDNVSWSAPQDYLYYTSTRDW